jgi:L,D-transpeptidase ErfK/SrfK
VGLHGTNAPGSIYRTATHGCIRLHPDDIARLYDRVWVGSVGRIVYEPVLLATQGDAVFLEVHRDVYGRLVPGARQTARALAAASGLTDRIDWTIADAVIEARHGIARDVSKQQAAP